MDGTSKSYIATTQIGWPNGLTIDFTCKVCTFCIWKYHWCCFLYLTKIISYTANRLYWTDGYHNRIESSDLNGGNRQVLATDSDAHLMSIVIHGQYLYYTAWNRQFGFFFHIHNITGEFIVILKWINNQTKKTPNWICVYKKNVWCLYCRRITKMNKITGLKVPFMMDYPELGRLDGLDIHSDEIRDGRYHR